MASFKDRNGREWVLSLDVFMAEQIRERTGWDFDTCLDDEMAGLRKILGTAYLLARAAYVLCEEQAEKAGVSPEQFGRAIGGDALAGMRAAFWQAVEDFCPPHQRTLLRTLAAKGQQVAELAAAQAAETIDAIKPASLLSATSSPASSESTPAPAG